MTPQRCCIVGTAPTWQMTPWNDPSVRIIGLNDAYVLGFPRVDEWYELHAFDKYTYRKLSQKVIRATDVPPGHYVRPIGHLEWLQQQAMTIQRAMGARARESTFGRMTRAVGRFTARVERPIAVTARALPALGFSLDRARREAERFRDDPVGATNRIGRRVERDPAVVANAESIGRREGAMPRRRRGHASDFATTPRGYTKWRNGTERSGVTDEHFV